MLKSSKLFKKSDLNLTLEFNLRWFDSYIQLKLDFKMWKVLKVSYMSVSSLYIPGIFQVIVLNMTSSHCAIYCEGKPGSQGNH